VLETLLWPDEVRPAVFPFLEQDIEVRPQELTMAASLIESMTSDFDPDAHHDGYREALVELVEAKVQGRELAQPATLEIAAGPSTSLADALRASLAAAQQAPKAGDAGGKAKAIAAPAEPATTGSAKASPAKASPAKGRTTRAATTRAATSKAATSKAGTDKAGPDKAGDEPAAGKPGATKAAASKTAKPARKAS
jgi:DNA end-binding protein Ku